MRVTMTKTLLTLGLCLLSLPGCSSSSSGSSGGATPQGSCTQKDGTCEEEVEADPNFSAVCSSVGATASAAHCDPTKFARKCEQTVDQSTNGGPKTTAHYVYYFPAGSTTTCLGTETKL
jgi:hypothetical protein